tara:strand:+ start:398 stop:523 length:126 start_codon:yes stop_codon:yes gene_type:complete
MTDFWINDNLKGAKALDILLIEGEVLNARFLHDFINELYCH